MVPDTFFEFEFGTWNGDKIESMQASGSSWGNFQGSADPLTDGMTSSLSLTENSFVLFLLHTEWAKKRDTDVE